MIKNKAGQKIYFYNTLGTSPVMYLSKDGGAFAALADQTMTEVDAVNLPGLLSMTLSQAETNADSIVLALKATDSGTVSQLIDRFDTTADTSLAIKAIKKAVNKAAYNKTTGVLTVYDDDGATELFTLTIAEADSIETRTRTDA